MKTQDEFELNILKGNIKFLIQMFSDTPQGCRDIVDNFKLMQDKYEAAGEFELGRIVSEHRHQVFDKGQRLQLLENQREFVGDMK